MGGDAAPKSLGNEVPACLNLVGAEGVESNPTPSEAG